MSVPVQAHYGIYRNPKIVLLMPALVTQDNDGQYKGWLGSK